MEIICNSFLTAIGYVFGAAAVYTLFVLLGPLVAWGLGQLPWVKGLGIVSEKFRYSKIKENELPLAANDRIGWGSWKWALRTGYQALVCRFRYGLKFDPSYVTHQVCDHLAEKARDK